MMKYVRVYQLIKCEKQENGNLKKRKITEPKKCKRTLTNT